MMRSTKRHIRQARAIKVRGKGTESRPPAGRGLRAIVVATATALAINLSPELTQAPTQADEPADSAIAGAATRASQTVGPILGVAARLEPSLPLRAARPAPLPTTADARSAREFQAALDAARFDAEAFGVTFAAVRDGQVVWAGSSGVTRDGRSPLKPGSTMVIGSITKTFVSAAVLQLVDEGRLSLSDSARQYLPELKVSRRITVRQLLDHTSGLADVFNEQTRIGLEQHPEKSWTSRELLATLHAPWYEPGEGWAYANTNYYLLGMIVERITGSSLEAELQGRFLDPLALKATRSWGPDDANSPLDPAWSTIFWGSGAMSSSAGDLARWGDALYDDDIPEQRLHATGTGRAIFDVNRDDYGLGVKRIEVSRRTAGYGHTGLLNAYTSLLLHLPHHDVTIAMLVNRTQVDLLGMIKERPAGGGPSLLRLAIDS